MNKFFSMLTALILVSLISVSAQEATLETYGVSPRDAAVDSTDIFDLAYNGLENVGKETKIYLVGSNTKTLAAPTWTVIESPVGAKIDPHGTQDLDSASQAVSFQFDLVGKYVVEFADGAAADSITINLGLYLGVKTGSPSCWMCHNPIYQKWEQTGHSDIFNRAMDGSLSTHYGPHCMGCHTTGLDPNANNAGFDDRDFVYPSGPDSLNEGTWDSLLVTSPLAMQLANIQCESCHGPGSGHNGDITDSKMVASLDVKNCAWCHDAGTHHAFPKQWEHSGDDATEFDGRGFHGGHAIGTWIGRGTRAGCAACHSGSGYVQWDKDGKPVDENGLPDDITTVPEPTLISCAVCHDPHDATEIHQLRLSDTQLGDGTPVTVDLYGTGAQCMECHRSRRNAAEYTEDPSNGSSHFGPHHGPQADMLIGANAPDFGWELPSSAHAAALENACVDCHMSGDHVAEADGSIILVGGHSFNMNDAEGNDHMESCEPCHGDAGVTFKEKKYYWNGNADHDGDGVEEGLQEEVHGMLEELATFLPQDSLGNVDMSSKTNSVAVLRGGYAYMWVEEDRSFGIHNPAFTVALLKSGIETLKYGSITAGEIQSVMDIPMDQGFQVRLVWTAFGADDGVARDAVKTYTILRKAADAAAAKGVVEYPTITQIPSDVTVGTTLALAGELWDVVKEVEAIQYIEYSAVVPTLHNTVEADTAWATFKVLGKTESGIIAETAPMDGHSIDDLAPMAPTNLSAQVAGNGVMLVWDEAVDSDFNFFEVYRSEEQGFVPSPEKLLSTTTNRNHIDLNVEEGKTYYYVVTAKDFSLNMSEASNEVNANITDVGAEAGIPTEYALNQNYPNPFNPSTAIKFAIPEASNVSLVIYDMLGNQVEVLVNNQMNAGYYTFTWNASHYASGIYFCQMTAKDFIRVNKMLLIK